MRVERDKSQWQQCMLGCCPPFPDPALPCLSSDLAKKIAGVCVRKPIDCQVAYRGISKKNILLLSSMLFGIPPLLTAYTPSAQLHVKRQWETGLRYSRSILPKCCANGIHVLLTCTIYIKYFSCMDMFQIFRKITPTNAP